MVELKKFYKLIGKNKREYFTAFFMMEVSLMVGVMAYWSGNKWGFFDKQYTFFKSNDVLLVVVFLCGFVGLTALYMLKEFIGLMEKERELEIQNLRLKQMEETNFLLKAQKHDFLNNIQVVLGLIQLNHIEKAQQYLKDIAGIWKLKEDQLNVLDKTQYPHLNALFSTKLYQCQELGIEIHYDMEEVPNLKFYPSIDLIRIFGNLIDNAIYAVKSLKREEKKINITLYKEEDYFVFEIYNFGPIIPDEIKKQIFNKGFTTKKNEGTGMGLYNVKNIVEKYEGKVVVLSEEGIGTIFTVSLPFLKEEEK